MRRSDYADLRTMLLEFYTPDEADRWMRLPHPMLGGRRAVDCLFSEVKGVIDALESGAYL
jgi:uncharacterized protein (DUF2384 family)